MDRNFIKWMVENAEGFSLEKNRTTQNTFDFVHFTENKCIYRKHISEIMSCLITTTLLQRAIEGVNRESCKKMSDFDRGYLYTIYTSWECVQVSTEDGSDNTIDYYLDKMDEDQAKESALKYIYEQTK